MENPKRARSWKRRLRPRVNLKNDVPVLYSTRSPHPLMFVTRRDRANRLATTMFRLTGELHLLYVAAAATGLLA
jgi:hypothetical protein